MAFNESTPVFIISLDRDAERRKSILRQFEALSQFKPEIIRGVAGGTLPDAVCMALTQSRNWSAQKGAIGCFLSHVKAWENIAKLSDPYAIVLEDDAIVRRLSKLSELKIPADAEFVFLNDRTSPQKEISTGKVEVVPMLQVLHHLNIIRGGAGTDGYLLTPGAAQKLLKACEKDLYFGHIDGRLLRYTTQESDLVELPEGSWISNVLWNHHDQRRPPTFGLLRGYSVSPSLVSHGAFNQSSREAEGMVASS
jgi:GR25 family glycosyltransferase involved in LPS biosynthesis